MSNPSNNGAQRLTPEQLLGRQVWELIQRYMMTGGTSEFVSGLLHNLREAINAPAALNARRSAEMLLEARSAQIPKETPDAESTELPPR